MSDLLPFALAALLVLMTPGPTNTLLAASGAAVGWRAAAALPLAEAAGYAMAIGGFLLVGRLLDGAGLPLLKAIAAAWLFYSALRLWREPVLSGAINRRVALRRIFITTLLNPKAMLVAVVLIPAMAHDRPLAALLTYLAISVFAGCCWVAGGSLLPVRFAPYAYRAAALVLGFFCVVAASSAIAG